MENIEEDFECYAEDMYQYEKELVLMYEIENKKNKRVLRRAKRFLKKSEFAELEEFLEETGTETVCEIIKESIASRYDKQGEEYFFKYCYVNQYCGMAGDDWSGNIWIPLSGKKRKYRKCLKVWFSC